MHVMIVGSGGREHALAWKLARHGHRVSCAPGNPGIAQVAACWPANANDFTRIERLARQHSVDLVVVGPEAPLVAGLADRLRTAGLLVFGPDAAGARLEGSKIFGKRFLAEQHIPTAPFQVAKTPTQAERAITDIAERGTGVVIKADGLAAGKGVFVCTNTDHAQSVARELLTGQRCAPAGQAVVIEQRLHGRELSATAILDGSSYQILAMAEDHKPVGDGDTGPNTGGMGAVSPCPWLDGQLIHALDARIFAPTVAGLRARGIEYRGALYAGLMLTRDGAPHVLEFNCRFGDPEAQVLVARLRADVAPWLIGAARGRLPDGPLDWDERTAVSVVLASAGYPATSAVGRPIHGALDATEEVVIFQSGTAHGPDQQLLTAGGRVLAVTALDSTVDSARRRAYHTVSTIHFDGMHYRTDIGARTRTAAERDKE